MIPRHRVSRTAIELIKRFEGYRRKAAQTPQGRWTLGYGHTRTAREGAEVSEPDAEALLLYDLIGVAHGVNEWVYAPLNQNQFDALCAFTFSIGLENFRRSAVLRRINEGAFLQAAAAMELWRKADFEGQRIVVDAMVRRRTAERALFLTPQDGVWIPAPSPILPPQLDMDMYRTVPREAPTVLTAPLDGDRAVARREPCEPAPVAPLTPLEDEGPTPVQKAASSVTSRLQNFFRTPERRGGAIPVDFPRKHRPEARFPAAGATSAQGGGQPLFELTPPEDEDERPPTAAPRPRLEVAAANEAAPGLFDTQFSSANDQTAVAELPAETDEASLPMNHPSTHRPAEGDEAPVTRHSMILLTSLAGAGLAVFAGSLYWFFNAWGGTDSSLLGRIAVWVACFAGITCFSLAAYLMLERLGQAAGDLGED